MVQCFEFFYNSPKKYDFLVRDRHEVLFNKSVSDIELAVAGLLDNKPLELVAEDLKSARSNLDEVVGVKYSDSLLGDIFSSFCIGK